MTRCGQNGRRCLQMPLQSRSKLKMNSYDPDTSPPPTDWLGTDEGERIELVASYHHQKEIKSPNLQLHAPIHVAVENQLALGEGVVFGTLARLQSEGLNRHDALHAIGSVLAQRTCTP